MLKEQFVNLGKELRILLILVLESYNDLFAGDSNLAYNNLRETHVGRVGYFILTPSTTSRAQRRGGGVGGSMKHEISTKLTSYKQSNLTVGTNRPLGDS